MHIELTSGLAKQIGHKTLCAVHPTMKDRDWEAWRDHAVNLASFTIPQLRKLREVLEPFKVKEARSHIRDIDVWMRIVLEPENTKLKGATFRGIYFLLQSYIVRTRRRWLFNVSAPHDAVSPWYVNEMEYHDAHTTHGITYPPRITVELLQVERGEVVEKTFSIAQSEALAGGTLAELLATKGWCRESESLIAKYERQHARYKEVVEKIGTQYLATGVGIEHDDEGGSRRWYRTETRIPFKDQGSKVILDVFSEIPEHQNKDIAEELNKAINRSFWSVIGELLTAEKLEDLTVGEDITYECTVPNANNVIVFDLVRHVRVKIHSGMLADYEYDTSVYEKVVLNPKLHNIVKMLATSGDSVFKDLIADKSGGMVVLLHGPPGVGKTLTAEGIAEAAKRPLYSVQCSQLGIDPEDVEDQLRIVYTRAARWNAVPLLDEADVYIRQRGSDLAQNAIVGVFLRVLEYQKGLLFFTTNRPKDVDDAIASRCIASLGYTNPGKEELRRIWKVLSESSGIKLASGTIDAVVKKFPQASGRDVKNLLKLASFYVKSRNAKEVTAQDIEYVHDFKPTGTTHE